MNGMKKFSPEFANMVSRMGQAFTKSSEEYKLLAELVEASRVVCSCPTQGESLKREGAMMRLRNAMYGTRKSLP